MEFLSLHQEILVKNFGHHLKSFIIRNHYFLKNKRSIDIENKLVSMNETVKIKDKILKNCIKIQGFGETSYNPGPPMDNINITVKKTEWYAPDLGLVKLVREEISDSETMGNVYYEKVINFN